MFEAYTVAVRVSLRGASTFTTGLLGIARAFNKANGGAVALEKRLGRIKVLLLGGAALTGAGLFGLSILHKATKAARDYNEELVYMRQQAGLSEPETQRIVKAAWNLSQNQIQTISATGALKNIMDLRSIFGAQNLDMAVAVGPVIAKAEALLAQMGNRNPNEQAFNIAKTLEMLGHAKDAGDFTKHLDMMLQGMQAFHAKLLPKDFQNTVTYLRSTRYGFSDEFLYRWLPTFMLEYKGGGTGGGRTGPGNALASLVSNLVYGQLQQRAVLEYQRMGLIRPGGISHVKGHGYVVNPGAVIGSELFQRDPELWVPQVLMPALKKHGININDQAAVTRELAYLAPNRTSQDVFVQLATQAWKFYRDRENIIRSQGLRGYGKAAQQSPELVQMARQAQFHNDLVLLGTAALPIAIKATELLTKAFNALGVAMRKHPGMIKAFVFALGGLSVLSLIAGGVMLFAGAIGAVGVAWMFVGPVIGAAAAGFMAVVAPALLAVGAAAAVAIGFALLAKHWKQIWGAMKHGASVAWEAIKQGSSAGWDYLTNAFSNGWQSLKTGVMSFFSNIAHWLIQHGISAVEGFMSGPHGPTWSPSGAPRPVAGPVTPVGVTVHHTTVVPVHLDGRKIAEHTVKHVAKGLGHTAALGRHDPTATLAPAGLGYSR